MARFTLFSSRCAFSKPAFGFKNWANCADSGKPLSLDYVPLNLPPQMIHSLNDRKIPSYDTDKTLCVAVIMKEKVLPTLLI